MLDFDVETTSLQPYAMGDSEAFLWIFSDGEIHEAIAFSPSGRAYPEWGLSEGVDEDARTRIQAWFDRTDELGGIRAHNSKFDWAFADAAKCFTLPGDGKWHDSMLVCQAIDERRSVALKAVAVSLFGEDAADPQKQLKFWLNAENARRSKVLKDAEKASAGSLKIDKRLATDEEVTAILAERDRLWDDETKSYIRANYSDVPASIMEPYAVEDVVLTRKVSDVYAARLVDAPDLAGVVEFERKAMDALYGVEKRGIPAQQHEYRKLEQEVIANLGTLEDEVMRLGAEGDPVAYAKALAGDRWGPEDVWVEKDEQGQVTSYRGGAAHLDDFNPKSSPQIIAALKARGANMQFMSQEKGTVSADADNLRAVDDELAVAILKFRSEFKVLSTYVRPMIGRSYVSAMNVYKQPFIAPDSKIHANYRQVGARTGRMSCSDPNMQNQPRDDLRLRYNIVADPGFAFVACDLSNIEMVLFSAYCGEGKLLTAVKNGDDLHTLTAQMLGLRDRKRAGGGVETARQLGKVYNFTTIYGGGLRSIRRYFRCDLNQARVYKRRYSEAYPEVGRLATRIEMRLSEDGYVQDKLISGRRFRVDVRDAYKATNYLVQGTAAALLKDAMVSLHADGVPMVALVHDEILAHVPADEASDVAALIEKRMTQAAAPGGQLWLPNENRSVVPLSAEADIVTRWSDAKPLKDDDGREYYFDPEWANVERRYV